MPPEGDFVWVQSPPRKRAPEGYQEWLFYVDGELEGRVWRRNSESEFIGYYYRPGLLPTGFPTLEEAQKAVEKAELEFWYA